MTFSSSFRILTSASTAWRTSPSKHPGTGSLGNFFQFDQFASGSIDRNTQVGKRHLLDRFFLGLHDVGKLGIARFVEALGDTQHTRQGNLEGLAGTSADLTPTVALPSTISILLISLTTGRPMAAARR
jgi:hypothetical protein